MNNATDLTPEELERARILRQRIEAGSQNLEDYRQLVDFLIPQGNYNEVVSVYTHALNLPLTNFQKSRLCMELGWNLYEIGRKEEAQKQAEDSILLLSREPEPANFAPIKGASLSLMAHCLWTLNESDATKLAVQSLEWLERAIASSGFEDLSLVYIELARVHNLLGNTDKAITTCEDCLSLKLQNEDRLSCLVIYSQALQNKGQFAQAERILNEILQAVRGHKGILPGVYLALGLIQRSTNRLNEAVETLQLALAALEADPYLRNDPELAIWIYRNMAQIYYQKGEYQESAFAYERLLFYLSKDSTDRSAALLWLGHSYSAAGVHDKAQECYDEVLTSQQATETDRIAARRSLIWNKAKSYCGSKNYHDAVAAFEEALSYCPVEDPNHCNALLWLAYSCSAIRAYERARRCLDELLTSPNATETEKTAALEALSRLPRTGIRVTH